MFDNSFADHKGPKKMAMMARSGVNAERPSRVYKNIVKRVMDSTLILLSLPFILPALIAVAVMIKRDGGSILYCQERVGINGRIFRMWKFRTMVPNAEEKLNELIANDPKVAREWHEHQKLKNDPRVTRIGAVLRKTSIDELPQLWNVLVGEMSLVGPRPMMVEQRALYPGKAYFDMRPGLTGLWQISDRHNGTFVDRAKFDASYYHQMSLATDVKILAATAGVVARGTGC